MNNFERLICTLFNNNIRGCDDEELTVEYVNIRWCESEIEIKYNKMEEPLGIPISFLAYVCDRGKNLALVNEMYSAMLAENLGYDSQEPEDKFVPECSNCGYDSTKPHVDNSPIKEVVDTTTYDKNYNFFKQKKAVEKNEVSTIKTNNSPFVKEELKLDLEDEPPYVDDDFTLLLALNGQIFII